jgi:hypothetical protein
MPPHTAPDLHPAAPAGLRDRLAAAWPAHRAHVLPGLLASLTLGLAPFYPHAHLYKQLRNLVQGTLTEWIDVLDLLLHGAPWLYLSISLGRWARSASRDLPGGSS